MKQIFLLFIIFLSITIEAKEMTEIYKAIKTDNITKVKNLYDKNSTQEEKIKLAISCVENNSQESLTFLINNGLKINSVDKENYNLLQQAVYFNQLDMIKLLLDKGLLLNDKKEGTRSNFSLSSNSSIETFNFLINKGMKPENDDKKHIVTNAMYDNKTKLAKYLLSNGYTFNNETLTNDRFILQVVKHGDIEGVKLLLKNGYSLDYELQQFYTKATIASFSLMYKQNELALYLMDLDVDIFSKVHDNNGRYFSTLVIESGQINILKKLLKLGYGINYKDPDNKYSITLLDMAFQEKQENMIKYLIEHGAKIEKSNPPKILSATELGYADVVKILVQKGANPYYIRYNSYDEIYSSLKDIADVSNNKKLANYLKQFDIEKFILDKFSKGTQTEIEENYLIQSTYTEKNLDTLLSLKGHKDFKKLTLQTFYYIRLEKQYPQNLELIFNILKEHNIEYDKYNTLFTTINTKTFTYLLNKYNQKDFLQTPQAYELLLRLIADNNIELVDILLNNKITTHIPNYEPIITYAVDKSNNEMIKFLINKEQIDISQRNYRKVSALEMVIMNNNFEIVSILIKKEKKLDKKSLIIYSIFSKNLKMFNFINKEMNTTNKDLENADAIYYAVKINNYEFMQAILDKGIDINKHHENGSTILAYAQSFGDAKIFDFLIKNGAKVNIEENKIIPFWIVSKYDETHKEVSDEKREDNIQILKILSKNSLSLDGCYGRHGCDTALSLSVEYKEYKLASILVDLNATVKESDISLALENEADKEFILKIINAYTYEFEEDMTKRWFPLFPSLKYGDNEITKLLIDKGFTNLSYINCNESSLSDVLISSKNNDILKYILEKDTCSQDLDRLKLTAKNLRASKDYEQSVKILEKALAKSKDCKKTKQ